MLSVHGQLAIKYGLRKAAAPLAVDFDTVITEITKLAQSTYAAATFARSHFSRLELLAAFSELLAARTSDTRRFGRFVTRRFDPQRDSYDWCKPKPLPASGFDQTSLRAALTAIRAITGQRTLTCDASESVVTIKNVTRAEALRTTQLFALTETFGLLNASVASTSIRLVARKYDG